MKQNIKSVLSIFGCVLVASVLSFMSVPITMLLKGPFSEMVINGIVPSLLLSMLIYSKMWELGWKIPSRRKLYNEKHSNYKALGICAAAFAPSLALLLLWKLTDKFIFELLFRIINFYQLLIYFSLIPIDTSYIFITILFHVFLF